MKKSLSIGALTLFLGLCLPALVQADTIHFHGAIVSPPCQLSSFRIDEKRMLTQLELGRCVSPGHAQLVDPISLEPAAQLSVTDLQGRRIDMEKGLPLDDHSMRIQLKNLDDQHRSRPLLVSITYQ